MAVWQFKVLLIPKAWAVEHNYNAAPLFGAESFDSSVAWSGSAMSAEQFLTAFDRILPRRSSWHEDQTAWGDDEATDIQLWMENGHIDEIQLRLHVGENTEDFVSKFIEAILSLDCVLFIPEKELIVEPSAQNIFRLAATSRAATFVANPHGYFQNLAAASSPSK